MLLVSSGDWSRTGYISKRVIIADLRVLIRPCLPVDLMEIVDSVLPGSDRVPVAVEKVGPSQTQQSFCRISGRLRTEQIKNYGEIDAGQSALQPASEAWATDQEQEGQTRNEYPQGTS